jgi:hypothetical protein
MAYHDTDSNEMREQFEIEWYNEGRSDALACEPTRLQNCPNKLAEEAYLAGYNDHHNPVRDPNWDRELGGATDGFSVYSDADPGL